MERRQKKSAWKRLRQILCYSFMICVMTPSGVVRAAEPAEITEVTESAEVAEEIVFFAEGGAIEEITSVPETEEVTEGNVAFAAAGTIPRPQDVEFLQADARKSLAAINAFRTGAEAWYLDVGEPVGGKRVTVKGLSKLEYDYDLEKAAMQRALECLVKFSHTRPDGTSFSSAIPNRYNYNWVGENLFCAYWGSKIPEAAYAVERWKESDCDYYGQGHRRNMLEDKYTHVGVAGVHYDGKTVWVQEFGGRIKDTSSQTITVGKEETVQTQGVWKKSAGKWWYRYPDGSWPASTWKKIAGKWYYFDQNGYMKTGWLKSGGRWYYLSGSGAMQTGWLKDGGKWYYLESSGAMLANTSKKIGSKTYIFNADGVCTNP